MARTKARQPALITTAPDTPPLTIVCPTCDRRLLYRQTVYTGVNPRERWDYFDCTKCGPRLPTSDTQIAALDRTGLAMPWKCPA
jgi:hypothetical protein